MSEIRLSTLSILDHYPEHGGSVGERLHRGLELCELADELGYEACWLGEHHFSNFGVMPNPAVWLAEVRRIRQVLRGPHADYNAQSLVQRAKSPMLRCGFPQIPGT
jgi:hypothetical protein